MNEHLASSTSPYLRAHADNPVAWHPWGDEAFAEARRRDVPVLVSIGYSTCHWCHVMARESFSDAATAAAVNRGFVAVKVDREEHPEVDAAYMAAAAAFTRNLGWPLTVFATGDGRPFYAGTYFPPEPRAGLPSFRQVLAAVGEAWSARRAEIDGTAAAVVQALAQATPAPHGDAGLPASDDIVAAAAAIAAREDTRHGGFGDPGGDAPKFPVATALRFLQTPLVRDMSPDAAAVADRALAAMAHSELRDRVEGGFFRYATRPDWTVPHYERMLTDNAQLLDVVTATSASGDVARDEIAAGIAGFLLGTLQQPSGGFGAAQDSESWIDGVRSEGGYYGRDAEERAPLEPPAVDGKVVTGWNGLAIGALAAAGRAFGRLDWVDAARRAADAVLQNNLDRDGRLVRASLDEIASRAAATLADHGQLATGLVRLAAASGDVAYAVRARDLVQACVGDDGAVVTPGGGDPVLVAQGMSSPDGVSDADEPGGRAAVAEAALQLWLIGAGEGFRGLAERVVSAGREQALTQPLAHGSLLRVAAGLAASPRQVVVVAESPDAPLASAARRIEADVHVSVTPSQAARWAAAGFALLEGRTAVDGRATVYDCRAFACRLPVTEPDDLPAS